jgi:very-short-patch-repair endonuclease/Zn finger protein HypA/HybF involved in hydrogenase expression
MHGDKYDYSQSNYVKSSVKIDIICKKHGLFSQLPSFHMYGSGCKKCADELNTKKRIKSLYEFIDESNKVHNNKYDYSQTIYKFGKEKVKIICKEHGEFLQQANAHVRLKQGCPTCGTKKQVIKRTKTLEQFIKESVNLHGNKYDYSKSNYINDSSKITIICKEHGEFEQKVSNHLCGKGCNKCADIIRALKKSKSIDKFILDAKNIHGDKYDYKNVIYKNSSTHVLVTCKIHADFKITPSNLLRGKGCPLCVNKGESKLYQNINTYYPTIKNNVKFDWCKNIKCLPFDFVIPEYNIIIELDGCQHFKQISNWHNPEIQYNNDKYKEKCANAKGYSIIRLLQKDIFYDNYHWLKELLETIEIIKNNKNEVKNYYLCKNNEYEKYIKNHYIN